jgi:hypothetical protein
MEFRRVNCTMLVEEISSLSIKIYGSLTSLLNKESLNSIEYLVFLDQAVIEKELSSFKKLFKSYNNMVSSKEREVFLHYVE